MQINYPKHLPTIGVLALIMVAIIMAYSGQGDQASQKSIQVDLNSAQASPNFVPVPYGNIDTDISPQDGIAIIYFDSNSGSKQSQIKTKYRTNDGVNYYLDIEADDGSLDDLDDIVDIAIEVGPGAVLLAARGGQGGGGKGGGGSDTGAKLPRCLDEINNRPALAPYATYLADNSKVQRAMNPCKISPAIISVFIDKLELAETSGEMPDAPLPASYDPENFEDYSYVIGGDETTEILGAKLAAIFYIEVNQMVPWRLADYNSNELSQVFMACRFPHCPDYTYADSQFRASNVLDYSPRVAWSVLNQSMDMSSFIDPGQAMDELLAHTRLMHHGGVVMDSSGTILRRNDIGVVTLQMMADEKVSRHGCWSMSPYLIQLAAAMNIPSDGLYGYYAAEGHATAVFSHGDQVLAHGDDVYNGLLRDTPSPEILDSLIRWENEILRYKEGNQTAGYNSQKHNFENAYTYPSYWVTTRYCAAEGAQRRAYLESKWKDYITSTQYDDLESRILSITSSCTTFPRDNPDG